MRIAAKRELHRAESLAGLTGASAVLTLPFYMAVLKAGLVGDREVASHIQPYVFPSNRSLNVKENLRAAALASNLWMLYLSEAPWRLTTSFLTAAAAGLVALAVALAVVVAAVVV